ncbi:heavy metal-binding protein HIP-like [Mercenaria mercenaria]|uniref:heavy metal-binding protein HIP-like n=1 Tax=Mercenaria mercenaria TaxID=6596 RepID=UPI00234ECE8E|nr:heavy metal-binding protein HIP-like [Mercenaria mercenaria]
MKFVFYLSFIALCVAIDGNRWDISKRILVDDNFYTLVAKLNSLEQQVSALTAQTSEIMELKNTISRQNNTISELQQEMAFVKSSQGKHNQIAFMAYLTKDVTGHNNHIYFDNVTLNLGNAYNPHHGTFVVPFNGTYQFTITTCALYNHESFVELYVNEARFGSIQAGDTQLWACSTKLFLINLKSGDDVYVKQHETAGDYMLSNVVEGQPCFTGVLLYQQ